jgi:CBS domain-containing membrane protein
MGAMIGIALTGLLGLLMAGDDPATPWLIAPVGASAVLLFAVPASPLAQPWPVLGGNVVSALIGIGCGMWIDQPLAAACIALACAIGSMFALRCLHPPGGAMAVMTALGATGAMRYGFGFALAPVALQSSVLLVIGTFYNRLCGRRYPHLPTALNTHRTTDPVPSARLGVSLEDLDVVLKQQKELLDISRDDLQEIFWQTEMHAYQRHFGATSCADIMSRDIVKVEFGTELLTAWRLLRDHKIKALPVVNRFNRVIGIVTQFDFLKQADLDQLDHFTDRLRHLLKRTPRTHSDKPEVVGQIMTSAVRTALASDPIVSLVPLFSDSGLHHIPVVDDNQRLVGIVTQSDLVAALYRARLEQRPAPAVVRSLPTARMRG